MSMTSTLCLQGSEIGMLSRPQSPPNKDCQFPLDCVVSQISAEEFLQSDQIMAGYQATPNKPHHHHQSLLNRLQLPRAHTRNQMSQLRSTDPNQPTGISPAEVTAYAPGEPTHRPVRAQYSSPNFTARSSFAAHRSVRAQYPSPNVIARSFFDSGTTGGVSHGGQWDECHQLPSMCQPDSTSMSVKRTTVPEHLAGSSLHEPDDECRGDPHIHAPDPGFCNSAQPFQPQQLPFLDDQLATPTTNMLHAQPAPGSWTTWAAPGVAALLFMPPPSLLAPVHIECLSCF